MAWWLFGKKTAKEQELEQLRELVSTLVDQSREPVEEEPEANDVTAVRVQDEEREYFKNSPTPWVKLVSDEFDPKHGFKISLDWNDAFVEKLRQSGYTGVDDNQLVQKWLAQTALNVAQSLEEQSSKDLFEEPDVKLDEFDDE